VQCLITDKTRTGGNEGPHLCHAADQLPHGAPRGNPDLSSKAFPTGLSAKGMAADVRVRDGLSAKFA